jgi:hypothetical protein
MGTGGKFRRTRWHMEEEVTYWRYVDHAVVVLTWISRIEACTLCQRSSCLDGTLQLIPSIHLKMYHDLKINLYIGLLRNLLHGRKKENTKYKLLEIFWTHPKTHHLDSALFHFLLQMPSDSDAPMRTQNTIKSYYFTLQPWMALRIISLAFSTPSWVPVISMASSPL